jgi:hypothetical protein
MLAREVVVVEVVLRGIVRTADIDGRHRDVGQFFWGGIAPHDRATVLRRQHAAGEQVVFVGATVVGHDSLDLHLGGAR